ncbi:MAG: hypothetical protein LC791_12330 [Acidobacteria bacterium]|nr:hypothetical protein [Acidobacteriota bacterium]
MEKHKEETREARGLGWLDELWQDVKYGTRPLLKHPGSALLAVLTLGLGIGANPAIFSVINGVLLKPLPYAESDRLVLIRQAQPGNDQATLGAHKGLILNLSFPHSVIPSFPHSLIL